MKTHHTVFALSRTKVIVAALLLLAMLVADVWYVIFQQHEQFPGLGDK